jgi:hypothetical protein
MEKNYIFDNDLELEIKDRIELFFKTLEEKTKNLVELELLDSNKITDLKKNLWDSFLKNHNDIRGNLKLVRYFILKKTDKLNKELKTKILLLELINELDDEMKDYLWNFLHVFFLFLENSHIETNTAIINTLADELQKYELKNKVEQVEQVKEREEIVSVKSEPNIKKNDILNMMKMMTESLPPNMKEMVPDMEQMLNNLGGNEGNSENFDIKNIMKKLIPEGKENKDLMKNIINDIKVSMKDVKSADEIFDSTKKLGEKYQTLLSSGEIDSNEILSSLVGLISSDELTNELSSIDFSNLKPEDMIGKLMGEMNLANNGANMDIASMISGLTNITPSVQEIKQDTPLTPEQIKEMEEFYSNINLDVD